MRLHPEGKGKGFQQGSGASDPDVAEDGADGADGARGSLLPPVSTLCHLRGFRAWGRGCDWAPGASTEAKVRLTASFTLALTAGFGSTVLKLFP